MLTSKQKVLLDYLSTRIAKDGVCPSYDEMRSAMKLQSKSGIHRLISALEERGFIKKLPNKARAIEIIKKTKTSIDPDNDTKTNTNEIKRTAPSKKISSLFSEAHLKNDFIEVPVFGKIAAGSPIEALREPTNYIKVQESLIGNGRHYALIIEGNSMSGVGILHKDIAIIRQASTAVNGQIIVALIDESEVTLKKYFQDQDMISLEPANINYETKTYPSERIQIQGHLIYLHRLYE